MKRDPRRVASACIVALCCLLFLAACGGDDNAAQPPAAAPTALEAAPAPAQTTIDGDDEANLAAAKALMAKALQRLP